MAVCRLSPAPGDQLRDAALVTVMAKKVVVLEEMTSLRSKVGTFLADDAAVTRWPGLYYLQFCDTTIAHVEHMVSRPSAQDVTCIDDGTDGLAVNPGVKYSWLAGGRGLLRSALPQPLEYGPYVDAMHCASFAEILMPGQSFEAVGKTLMLKPRRSLARVVQCKLEHLGS